MSKRIGDRLKNLLTMGTVVRAGPDSAGPTLQAKGLAEETFDGVEHLVSYGDAVKPVPISPTGQGAESVLVAIERDLLLAMPMVDRRYVFPIDLLKDGDRVRYTFRDNLSDQPGTKQRIIESEDENVVSVTTILVSDGAESSSIVLSGAGVVTINASVGVKISTPRVETSDDLIDQVDGTGNTNTVRGMRTIYDGHEHPERDAGGPTESPNQKQGPG